ncbi:MAG: HEAT repeat domain-containing protein [Phycisphaerales bacterium]|nr:MAG: HEAT repeat domain-containing protein [Phycisphaerales bacterium]
MNLTLDSTQSASAANARRNHDGRTRCRAGQRALALVIVTGLFLAGCDTLSQDFDLIAQSFFPPSPGEAARMMEDPHDPDQRREGVTWISNSPFGGAEPYLRSYRDKVEHERDPTVLAAAIRALARHGMPDDAPLIARHLTHENRHVQWAAAKGLQRLHNPDVVAPLLAAVRQRENWVEVRIAAADALAQYPQDRVFQALVATLDARELALNQTAAESLRTLTGQEFDTDARAWINWYRSAEVDERFADRREYLYPTYQRDETFFERLAFWTSHHWETPQQPAGLRPESTRRTYQDEDDASDEADG